MSDVPAGRSLPLVAEYRDASFWSSSFPAGIASSDRSSFSLSCSVFFGVIGHLYQTGGMAALEKRLAERLKEEGVELE